MSNTNMQIESEYFTRRLRKPASWDEHTYRYCKFSDFNIEGPHITSFFIDCTFENCEMYIAMFNMATLVGVTFRNCRFKGCSLVGCRIVECTFEGCQFTRDNMDASCRFEDTRWYNCKQTDTVGLDVGEVSIQV